MRRGRRYAARAPYSLNYEILIQLKTFKTNHASMLALATNVKKEQNWLGLQISRSNYDIENLADHLSQKPKREVKINPSFILPIFPIGQISNVTEFDRVCQSESYCDQIVSNFEILTSLLIQKGRLRFSWIFRIFF